jgi:hypothetical protein
MNNVTGFLFSFVIVVIIFVVSAFASGYLADLAGIWKKPVIGSSAAFCVVITGYATAPNYKRMAASLWLVAGAIAAWVLTTNSTYPEDQPSLIPLVLTYLSGLIALLICIIWHKKHSKKVG